MTTATNTEAKRFVGRGTAPTYVRSPDQGSRRDGRRVHTELASKPTRRRLVSVAMTATPRCS